MSRTCRLSLSRTRALVLASFLGLTAAMACSSDAPPTLLSPDASSFALNGSLAAEGALEAEEHREKARIARAQEASKRTYDSLTAIWTTGKDSIAGDDTATILFCDPLGYAADVQIIGPEGGDMSIGPHKLSIPKGALTEYVVITGEMPVSLSVGVKLHPHGLRFDKQPSLELSYKHCIRPPDIAKFVAYVGLGDQILELPPSKDDQDSGLVKTWIKHFSGYMVAYRGGSAPDEF